MVWVITGDGDALSIGGNHLIHAMRRNVDMKMIMFNNRIYGLTKGQASPTSPIGKKTKSTPLGTIETPIIPLNLVAAAEASFIARSVDTHSEHLQEMMQRAGEHSGAAFLEVLQNCNIFNDGAWEQLKDADTADDLLIKLVHGEPIRFGKDGSKGVVRTADGQVAIANVAEVGEDALLVHDAHREDPSLAFALSRLSEVHTLADTPIGIFRDVTRPSYDRLVREQLDEARDKKGAGDLQALVRGGDTWLVG
jgi:2-oxoglutarate ferredoxin oxidoreductase subunit beta